MRRSHYIVVLLIVLAALSQSACAPPECDPNSELYDPDECETLLGQLIEYFTSLAYGNPLPPPPPPGTSCPASLVCLPPHCLFVQENGSFEVESANGQPPRWHGDEVSTTISPSCHEGQSLDFLATTPEGASASVSAQVYQVIDLAARVPEALQDELRRVRAQAAFAIQSVEAHDDRRFGLRLDAYAGDPATFPREGDPETFPIRTGTYERLASATDAFSYAADGEPWQAETVELALPEDTDFVVVLLEHEEDVQNDTDRREFLDHGVDYVQVALDGGNVPPVARVDRRTTAEDTPASITVTANDTDPTSRIDQSSVQIVQPPVAGTATVDDEGRVRYVPDSDFHGAETFTYVVADEEGLVSNEAPVLITVRSVNDAPVATEDAYTIPEGGFLTVPTGIGVLANDADADGDTLTAELVQDVGAGSLSLDASGAFTYSAPDGFSGTTTFTYRATDGEATSGEATVTLTRDASGYDLALDKTATPTTVGPSAEATFTIDVTNNGPGTATGVVVTDQVPDFETTIQSTATTQGSYDLDSGLWTVGELAAGQTATLTITALIHLTVTNAAFITGGLDEDTTPGNNSDEVVVTVVE
jgi:uncharacterized repeat protein (TIGR01451 family)